VRLVLTNTPPGIARL